MKGNNKIDEKQIQNIIAVFFEQFTGEVSNKVNIELEDSKRYIYGFEEEVRMRLGLYEENFGVVKREC